MKRGYTVAYRRKREGKTNYRKRVRLLLSRKLRLVVRLTNQRVLGQVIEFHPQGDKVLAGVDSSSLKKKGWTGSCRNIPAAYVTGFLLGTVAKSKNCRQAVLDTGPRSGSPRLYAFLCGAIDAGLDVPHDPAIFPSPERLQGKHLKNVPPVEKMREKIKREKIQTIDASGLKKNA